MIFGLLKMAFAGVAESWNFVHELRLPANVDSCQDMSLRSKAAESEGCRNGDFGQNQLFGQNWWFWEIANLEVLQASNRSKTCQNRFFTPKYPYSNSLGKFDFEVFFSIFCPKSQVHAQDFCQAKRPNMLKSRCCQKSVKKLLFLKSCKSGGFGLIWASEFDLSG